MDKEALKKVVESVTKDLKEANEKVDTLRSTLSNLKNICPHDMIYTGHDSHKDHYECSICGFWEDY